MSTPIESIAPLWSVFPSEAGKLGSDVSSSASPLFADIFASAIEDVKVTDQEKNHAEYLLATGQLDNPAELMTALSNAELSASLLVQLRNRSLDAYNELMRIGL